MERETVMHRATILDPPTEPVPKPELICEPYVHATEKRVFLINLNSFELWHGHGATHHRHTYIHDSLRLMSTVITLHSISAGSPINARGLCPCLTRGPVRLSGGRARSASTPSLSQRTHSHFLGWGALRVDFRPPLPRCGEGWRDPREVARGAALGVLGMAFVSSCRPPAALARQP